MKKLIINVDDAGFSEPINDAVRKCYEAGIITGVSIMACGGYFEEACAMLRGLGKNEAGVHFTLTGDLKPCTEDISFVRSLLGKGGRFIRGYKGFALNYFRKVITQKQILCEFENQIKKVKQAGFNITHLDSHEHIHMFPAVLEIVITLARRFNIPYVRIPFENMGVVNKQFSVINFIRHAGLKVFASRAMRRWPYKDIKHNDAFFGHFHSGRINEDILIFMLKNLSQGITEMAVHPAMESRGFLEKYPWYQNAPQELNLLLKNDNWKAIIKKEKIQLVSHSEA